MKEITIQKLLFRFRYVLILAALMVVLTILNPGSFLSASNLSNVLWSVAVTGIMACGTICVILVAGIDLAVGSVAGLSGVVAYLVMRAMDFSVASVFLGCGLALFTGITVGLLHGITVTSFAIPPFLVTLATSSIINGFAIAITGGETFGILQPEAFLVIGKRQMPIIIMFVLAVISYFILNHTSFGRYIYAVGGNSVASRLSGIPSRKVILTAYILSGLTAAIGGVVLSSMAQQSSSVMGKNYEMDVLTAIVVGGGSLAGGEGSIQGAIFGAVLVGLINNGLNLMNVSSTYHPVVKGIVIVAAVALDFFARNRGTVTRKKRAASAAA